MEHPSFTLESDRPLFVLLGDSLTQRSFEIGGWGALISGHYSRKADILNRGFSGYNTQWLIPMLPSVFPAAPSSSSSSSSSQASAAAPVLVTIWFGANDSVLQSSGIVQFVPVQQFKSNLETIIEAVFSHYGIARTRILVMTPPPVVEAMRLESHILRFGENAHGLDRSNQNTFSYAIACQQVVNELAHPGRVQLLDMFTILIEYAAVGLLLSKDVDATSVYLSGSGGINSRIVHKGYTDIVAQLRPLYVDGLHFSPAGQAIVFQSILDKIDSAFPEFAYGAMSNHLPWHADIKANPNFLETQVAPVMNAINGRRHSARENADNSRTCGLLVMVCLLLGSLLASQRLLRWYRSAGWIGAHSPKRVI